MQSHYQNMLNEVKEQVKNVIQFIFLGRTFGPLNPLLINPEKLKYFIENEPTITSHILTQFPNLLYQSGRASIIQADFNKLQFTFLLSYPQFGENPIFPFYTIKQIGFLAKIVNNDTECLMLNMPQYAVVNNNSLYILRKMLNCPSFGNVFLCYNKQLDLYPVENCLDIGAKYKTDSLLTPELTCPMIPCYLQQKGNEVYVSTKAGILLRTQAPYIQIAYTRRKHQLDLYSSANAERVPTASSGAMFVPWKSNVSAVTFGSSVIYSPVNADNAANIKVTPINPLPALDVSTLLAIPQIGTDKIQNIMNSQQERIDKIERELIPSSLSVMPGQELLKLIPAWIKVVLCILASIIIMLSVQCVYKQVKQCGKVSGVENRKYEALKYPTNMMLPAQTLPRNLNQTSRIESIEAPPRSSQYHNLLTIPQIQEIAE
jgi:hypothetical protein